MQFDSNKPEVVEPALSLIGAVADDEMIAVQRLVVKVIPIRGIVKGVHGVANDNGIGIVADVDGTIAQVVIKLYTKRFLIKSHLYVGIFHVTAHQ